MPIDPARPRRRAPIGAALMLALGLVPVGLGCGGFPSGGGRPAPPPTGPHGGVAVALPDDAGFGEVVIEPAPGGARRGQALVVVYFYGPDLATPAATPPATAEVKLALPGGDSAQLALASQPKSGTPGPPRFASRPGPYQLDTISGELTVGLGGRTSTIPFAGGR